MAKLRVLNVEPEEELASAHHAKPGAGVEGRATT